jgi:hypothetical protein|tara:strand:- start:209 stop:517 length:309 start_codon:yes stop_codon:yes gene_type:complete
MSSALINQKIKNIDEHIILVLNILKHAQNKGTAGIVKLANGFMEYETAAKIFDVKPSSGESIKLASQVCSADPDDTVTRTTVSLIDKRVDGPWSNWIVLRSE